MKVVTFGEIMLRLMPEGDGRFVQAGRYNASYGGGEASVAVSLANFGLDSKFVSRLPKHEIGQAGVNALRKFGVDTTDIVRGGDRVGICFLERGAGWRPPKEIYDRTGSSISQAVRGDFDWDRILEGADWFHFTAITPALSDNTAEICLEAVKKAREKGITVSCGLDYQSGLWSGQKAGRVMGELCKYVDVCIAGAEDVRNVFGIREEDTNIKDGRLSREGYRDVAKRLADRFGFRKVAVTPPVLSCANESGWAALLYDGEGYYFSRNYNMHIVDRTGGSDSFGAGLIYACLRGMEPEGIIEFAAAACCFKYGIEGAFNLVTADEVLKLAAGDASGRVRK